MRSDSRDVQLVTKRVPAAFLSRFLVPSARWWLLIAVSPWLTTLANTPHPLERLARKIEEQNTAAYVITRPPDGSIPGHLRAVERLAALPNVEMRFNPSLHAKILLAEGPRTAIGLMGSANLTTSGYAGVEVGVLLHGRGSGEVLIRDLIDYCMWDLRANSKLIKGRKGKGSTL